MSERKYAITEMKNAFDLFISNENIWWQNQWAWTQIDRNLPEWNAKRKKTEGKHRTEYPRTVGSFQKMFPMLGLRIPEGEARTGRKKILEVNIGICSCSVAQLCLTLCDPMDCSTPGFPVHHHLLELAQTHVYLGGDAIQPSYPLSSPFPPAFNLSQHQGLFQWVSSSHQVTKVLERQPQHQSLQWIFRIYFL